MIFEWWLDHNAEVMGSTFMTQEAIRCARRDGQISPSAKLMWTVEADTREEAMKLYNEHRGYEPYTLTTYEVKT